jgi:UDP-N-acetylmuramate dehydrogenase
VLDLTPYNTLRLPAKAKKLFEINTEADIKKLPPENIIFLGEGANILFKSPKLDQLAKINLRGKKVIKETADSVLVEIAAGENWHNFVTWAVNQNLSGVENMALVPGSIGAAAIGNIACYGQNQEDVFIKLQATNLKSHKTETFNKKGMDFGYRESILKNPSLNYLITSVTYKLSKTAHLELSYHAARHASLIPTLQQIAKEPYTIRDVYNAIIKIRTEKLPDPKKVGTAGSFFKNPIVLKTHYLYLKSQINDLQVYPFEKLKYTNESEWIEKAQKVKLPAGHLLDELGWRGKRIGNVGTYHTHALTVVTYPGATGPEVYEFTENMRADVKKNFNIDLEYEVVIL